MSQEELRDINAKPRPRIKLKEGSCHPIEKIRNFKSVPKSQHKKAQNNFTQDREDILHSFHHKNDKESQALDTLRYLNDEDTWDHSLEIENKLKTAVVSNMTTNPPKNPKDFMKKSHSTSCFKLPASPSRAKRTYKLPMISVLKDTFSVSEENLSASLPRRLQGITTYRNADPSEKAAKIQDIKEVRDSYLYGRAYCGMLALGTIKSTENKEAATEKPPLSDRMKESLEENNTTEEGAEDPYRLAYQTREATSLENFEPSVREISPKVTPKDAPENSGTFEPLGNTSNVGKGTFFRVTFSGTNGFKKTVKENNDQGGKADNKVASKPENNFLNDLIQKSWHDKELFRKLLQKHSDEDLLQLKLKLLKETEPPKKQPTKPKKERSQSRALTARMPVLAIDLKESQIAEADSSSSNDPKESKPKTDRRESKSIEKSPHVLNMQRYASVNSIVPTRRQSEKIEKRTLYERTQDKIAMKGYNIFKLSTLQVPLPSNMQTLNPTPQSARLLNEDNAVKAPKAPNVRSLSFKVKNDRPSSISISQTLRDYNNQDSSYGIQRLRKMSPATPTTYLSVPKEKSRDIKSFLTTRVVQEEQETLAVKEVSDLKRQSPLIMTSSGPFYEKGGTISKVIEQLKNEKVPMPKLSIRKIQL